MLQNIINFYKNCYITDRASSFIKNIFSKSLENTYFLSGRDEVSSGNLPYQPVDEGYAQDVIKKLTIAEKEKELIFCTLFVVAKVEGTHYCSPLLTYPARVIEKDELYFVEIDKEHKNINTSVFSEIISENIDFNQIYEQLYNALLNNDLQIYQIKQISEILKKYLPKIDVDSIFIFPEIMSEKELKSTLDSKEIAEGQLKLLPASCFTITRKSINTRGIINELNYLSGINDFSEPLMCIFNQKDYKEAKSVKCGYYPALLSQNQQNIIKHTSRYPFSVIIGPPGTGKSYTIANLAIEKMSTGKSVLIAAGTDKAVDIIAEKITMQLEMPDIIIRAGRKEYKKQLVDYLNQIVEASNNRIDTTNLRRLKFLIETNFWTFFFPSTNLNSHVTFLTKRLQKIIEKHQKWSEYLYKNINKSGFWTNLKKKTINYLLQKQANPQFYLTQLFEKIELLNKTIKEFLKEQYEVRLKQTRKKNFVHFRRLLTALRSRSGTVREKWFKDIDFDVLLKVFPIWLVKMSDIAEVLPLTKELFDYVIIDEATQCDIASSIPVIQRGKKLVITGDPKQLRHFSFLAEAKQRVFRHKFNLLNVDVSFVDYKNNSLLDLVMNNCKYPYQFHYLDEHFRSLPAIIGFSNKKFYNNKLRIMTARPDLKILEGVEIIKTDGRRHENGTNPQEAEVILDFLKLIINQQKQIPTSQANSIGIISPFTDQVEFLQKQVEKNFKLSDLQKHRVTIATPYGFQGDERDIVFMSFVVDNNSNNLAYRYMNKDDVFNVSITRARKKIFIITSVEHTLLSNDNLLRQYLEYFESLEKESLQNSSKDLFASEIISYLSNKGYSYWENFEIAGMNIDIVYTKENQLYGIDLIGYPGIYSDAIGIERYKILSRAGIQMKIISYSNWLLNKNDVLELL